MFSGAKHKRVKSEAAVVAASGPSPLKGRQNLVNTKHNNANVPKSSVAATTNSPLSK